jgi:NAD(P)H-quinone oxidoreductase subunit 5
MMSSLLFPAALAVPLSFILAALSSSRSPRAGALVASLAMLAALALVALLVTQGPGTTAVLGIAGIGLSFRVDALSVALALLISGLGLVIVRYSLGYLDGEAHQGRFMRHLCLTLAAVAMMVMAGNLYQFGAAWIAMGWGVHALLLHYAPREASLRAAKRKFVVARTGDVLLLLSLSLILTEYGTADIATLINELKTHSPGIAGQTGAVLLAIAAMLKSAQFPLHSWLLDVVETPTPVSALLHAGVVNAGGFALIRFADLMFAVPGAMLMVAIVGALTALLASAIMLTQTRVKVALAWSTIAQMGFMMLQCGLGAFTAAAVHLIAHSLYKAHAFLNSGQTIVQRAAARAPRTENSPLLRRGVALGAVLAIYGVVAYAAGVTPATQPALLGLGALFAMGLWLMLFDFPRAPAQWPPLVGLTAMGCALWFGVHRLGSFAFASALPPAPTGSKAIYMLLAATLLIAAVLVLWQSRWLRAPSARVSRLRAHLRNGLYADVWFDRLLGLQRRASRVA